MTTQPPETVEPVGMTAGPSAPLGAPVHFVWSGRCRAAIVTAPTAPGVADLLVLHPFPSSPDARIVESYGNVHRHDGNSGVAHDAPGARCPNGAPDVAYPDNTWHRP